MGAGPQRLNRRDWLRLGATGVAGLTGAHLLDLARRGGAAEALAAAGLGPVPGPRATPARQAVPGPQAAPDPGRTGAGPGAPPYASSSQEHMGVVGEVRPSDGFDPDGFLTHFDYGETRTGPDGRTIRHWEIVAVDREIEIAPGVWFPAWAYNGQVPGPTLRCTEGDRVEVEFVNAGSHPHTIHFHGQHPPEMDGVEPMVRPGERFTYTFEARPFGLYLYHCHTLPLTRHIHKGLYGTFIVDPPAGRAPAREMVMVMNGFDTNFDGDNEVYAVNTAAFYHRDYPIRVGVGDLCRVYLVNVTEFDPINSFHLHAAMFRLFRTGTRLDGFELTDTVMMCQGERHILEFELTHPGRHMFHAHQSEFAELGWMGFFEAVAGLAAEEGVPVSPHV